MTNVLEILKNEFEKLNIPYTFDEWDKEIGLPQFIGELHENPTVDEDGMSEYTFILTGYAIDITYLFSIAEQLKSKYKTSAIVNGVVIKYDNFTPIDTGTEDYKQIQITLKIKQWSVY